MIEDRERAVAYVTGRIVSSSTARLVREVRQLCMRIVPRMTRYYVGIRPGSVK
jgi:hypothetical protein